MRGPGVVAGGMPSFVAPYWPECLCTAASWPPSEGPCYLPQTVRAGVGPLLGAWVPVLAWHWGQWGGWERAWLWQQHLARESAGPGGGPLPPLPHCRPATTADSASRTLPPPTHTHSPPLQPLLYRKRKNSVWNYAKYRGMRQCFCHLKS